MIETSAPVKQGETVTFEAIKYTNLGAVGTHTYQIREVIPEGATEENNYTVDGVIYDTHVETVQVKVEDAGNGTLTVTYNGQTEFTTPEFVNDVEEETIDIPVEKRWVGTPKESVTVKLLADGSVIDEAVLSKDNNWKHVFTDLPKYDSSDDHEIVYTVSEDPVPGYTASITGDAASGFVITNTETPPPPPPTGDENHLGFYFAMMIVSGFGLIAFVRGGKKPRRKKAVNQ